MKPIFCSPVLRVAMFPILWLSHEYLYRRAAAEKRYATSKAFQSGDTIEVIPGSCHCAVDKVGHLWTVISYCHDVPDYRVTRCDDPRVTGYICTRAAKRVPIQSGHVPEEIDRVRQTFWIVFFCLAMAYVVFMFSMVTGCGSVDTPETVAEACDRITQAARAKLVECNRICPTREDCTIVPRCLNNPPEKIPMLNACADAFERSACVEGPDGHDLDACQFLAGPSVH